MQSGVDNDSIDKRLGQGSVCSDIGVNGNRNSSCVVRSCGDSHTLEWLVSDER